MDQRSPQLVCHCKRTLLGGQLWITTSPGGCQLCGECAAELMDPVQETRITEYLEERPVGVWLRGSGANSLLYKQLGRAQTLKSVLSQAFLPEGYPSSVSPDFTSYQLWDCIQALTSYVRGVLSAEAIYKGVGVGDQTATAVAAVFTLFVRDTLGTMVGMMFAVSTGSGFDSCAKQWRLFADVINDVGMAVELISPHIPGAFILLACIGHIARALAGVAGGATRAALTQHFAREQNAADVSAKDQAKERLASIVGSLVGMAISKLAAGNHPLLWAIFLFLSWLHVYANKRALRCLVLSSLNVPRLQLLLRSYSQPSPRKLPPPREVAATESLLAPPLQRLLNGLTRRSCVRIIFGARLSQLATTGADIEQLISRSGPQQPYLVTAKSGCVYVVLHRSATSQATLQAYVHALRVAVQLELLAGSRRQQQRHTQSKGRTATGDAGEGAALKWMATEYAAFLEQLRQSGWRTEQLYLPRALWTAEWSIQSKRQ